MSEAPGLPGVQEGSAVVAPRNGAASTVPPGALTPGGMPPEEMLAVIQNLVNDPEDSTPTIISGSPKRALSRANTLVSTLRGRRLAQFELQEPLGVGGMAAVIRAYDVQLQRTVALKVLPPAMAVDPESVSRFHQEARAAARLDHEAIAQVYYCGEDQGLHFIAYEFVEGENLKTILDRRGRLPAVEAVPLILQVASGLAHAAARGVVHRDIKPSNIITTPEKRAKLVDMGLARNIEPHLDGGLTHSGVTLGTFDYISPEQALEPREADVRSDIYSLGCTLYHIVTGQPSVPEGTAAKKLHHHQHVLPVDPRLLNPDVPDELAVILGRMMAKAPKDRYQHPDELIRHLLHVAQQLGCAPDLPNTVSYLAPPLPSPPRLHPVMLLLVAAGITAVLVVVSGWFSGSTTGMDVPPALVRPGNTTQADPTPRAGLDKGQKRIVARNAQELADAFKHPLVHIQLDADLIDLKGAEGEPVLSFHGEELVIEPLDPTRRPVIQLTYSKLGKARSAWTGLKVTARKAVIRGLDFVLNGGSENEAEMQAIEHEGGGSLLLESCQFVQENLLDEKRFMFSSLLLTPPSTLSPGGPARVAIKECWFKGGDKAILIAGPAQVRAENCAFGPHTALFHMRATKLRETSVDLSQCSAILANGSAAFHLGRSASCGINVSNSIFSCPQALAPGEGESIRREDDRVVLVRQLGGLEGDLRYETRNRNVYHNLTAFWVRQEPSQPKITKLVAFGLDDFRKETATEDDHSVLVAGNPWEIEEPLKIISSKPESAFRLNQKKPELRQLEKPAERIVGVERCTWGKLYRAELPAVDERSSEAALARTRIVDPTVKQVQKMTYPTLALAVSDARPGDIILIKHDGELAVDQVRLEKGDGNVTIRPHPKCHPILKPGACTDPEAALFRILDDQLTIESVEFRLQPPKSGFTSQSVALVAGDGQCTFKNCIVTLEGGPDKDSLLGLVRIVDPGAFVRPESQQRAAGPKVRLESCFIRGEGDLLSVAGSRPFGLTVKESLIVLDGSFINVEGLPRDVGSQTAQLTLDHVTTHLSKHFLLLRAARDERHGLVPVQVTPANCVFASAKGSRSYIHVEGLSDEQLIRSRISWLDGKQNLYSNFTSLLDNQPRTDDSPLAPYDQAKWETFAKETDARFVPVKFQNWPTGTDPAHKARVRSFKVKEPDNPRAGANIETLLTLWREEEGSTAP